MMYCHHHLEDRKGIAHLRKLMETVSTLDTFLYNNLSLSLSPPLPFSLSLSLSLSGPVLSNIKSCISSCVAKLMVVCQDSNKETLVCSVN